MAIYFSASKIAFYDGSMKDAYVDANAWSDDSIEISNATWLSYLSSPPDGKQLGSDSSGSPAWVDTPAKPNSELYSIALSELSDKYKLDIANLSSAYANAALTDGTTQTTKQAALQAQYSAVKTQFASDLAALKTTYGV